MASSQFYQAANIDNFLKKNIFCRRNWYRRNRGSKDLRIFVAGGNELFCKFPANIKNTLPSQ